MIAHVRRYEIHPQLSPVCACACCRARRSGWLTPWLAVLSRLSGISLASAIRCDESSLLAASVTRVRFEQAVRR